MFNDSFNCDMLEPSVVIILKDTMYELFLILHGIHEIWTIDGSTVPQVNGS